MRATARRPASNWRSLHSPPFAMMAVENISGSHPAEVQNLGIFSLKLKKFRAVCRTGENSFSDKGVKLLLLPAFGKLGPLLQLMGALCMGNKLTLKFDSKGNDNQMLRRQKAKYCLSLCKLKNIDSGCRQG
ncbi:uncharacterized protein LOC103720422 isoform X2 [Phoenix dactylifera]|uniref:Uncharacterized protein LOC103720422 isoform X2 n=1 Tax=Phoenix dactylifera TaxID=42345 RepID=A0A8B8JCC0_PHODC|nr:uncharacterized protein LOC103720422 isoform X2 [Phoenix dactylifera]